ncbi:hypothetical protein CPB86DRAFT_800175 [Serendipita vermifera]|nr:hypothetical protein CPB86DRAFT_800175 [Serendipita vermifera]
MSQSHRVFVLVKKSEGLSDGEFRKKWEKAQVPKIVPLMKKHGASFYSQTYMNRDGKHSISQGLFNDNSHTADYDGISTTVFPSAEAADAFLNDKEHQEILKANPRDFVQMNMFRAAEGEEVVFLDLKGEK